MTTRRCLDAVARAFGAGVHRAIPPPRASVGSTRAWTAGLVLDAPPPPPSAPSLARRAFAALASDPPARVRGERQRPHHPRGSLARAPAHALEARRGKKKRAGKAAASARDDADADADDASPDASKPTSGSSASPPPPSEYDPEEADELMRLAVESLERDLGKLRVGRASPGMLENLVVDAYGEKSPLRHLGTVAARNAQTLTVMLYDPALRGAVKRAIEESSLGFNPREDGDALLVPVPEMTAETRRNVGKLAAKAAEAAKISVRNARKKGMDAIKKAQMTEDERKRAEKALQGRHDEHVKRASELAAKKEKQIAGEA